MKQRHCRSECVALTSELRTVRLAQVLFRDHKAHSPFPASTGVNRSHVQPLGSSCLPFVSLTSMFPFACMRMYRLWISDLTMRKQRDRARLICLSLDLNCTTLVSNLNSTYQMLRNLLEVMLCDSATQLLQPILPALFHDQNAISPFPASTTWNLSQVQSEGSSSLPLWPLPSMFPFEFIPRCDQKTATSQLQLHDKQQCQLLQCRIPSCQKTTCRSSNKP